MTAAALLNVRKIRRRLGFSQATLALVLGVHWVTVSRWECGGKATPSRWCAGLLAQFATIPDPKATGAHAEAFLVSHGVPRALYELLRHSEAARMLQRMEGAAMT